jgi:hypothetical protein
MNQFQKDEQTQNELTVITLMLPEPNNEGTLLIQRGELAHVRQFTYAEIPDITNAIQSAMEALILIESNPPIIPDTPSHKTPVKAAPVPKSEPPQEPTIDIPLKKGVLAVPISYLKIMGGETDAVAYRQAVLMAGKLIDGRLWDGKVPIRFDDVYQVQRKLKGLTDKELSLFTLEDFAQRGPDSSLDEVASVAQDTDISDDDVDEEADLVDQPDLL